MSFQKVVSVAEERADLNGAEPAGRERATYHLLSNLLPLSFTFLEIT